MMTKVRLAKLTREQWLNAFIQASRPAFEAAGFPIPQNVRASIGFTSKGARSNTIGQCWDSGSSKDGHFEIFIRPSLQGKASRVADVLVHECVHAAVGLADGHGPKFRKCAKALGLQGKMTATVAGPAFHAWADPILAEIGPFPGDELQGQGSGKKKQTTRLLKLECDSCEFTCRTTAKHIQPVMYCPFPDCSGSLHQEGAGSDDGDVIRLAA
jgi:hypothetical protein